MRGASARDAARGLIQANPIITAINERDSSKALEIEAALADEIALVECLDNGKTLITSQNHCFAVEPQTLPPGCRVTARAGFAGLRRASTDPGNARLTACRDRSGRYDPPRIRPVPARLTPIAG